MPSRSTAPPSRPATPSPRCTARCVASLPPSASCSTSSATSRASPPTPRPYVERIADTQAKIYDTRKTLPGLRGLQKYAVACGGGHTHRMGLYDAVLVKDNHLAHVPSQPPEALTEALRAMVQRAHVELPNLKFVMVEVDTLEQLDRVLPAGVGIVLLDNMSPGTLSEAVRRRDAFASENPDSPRTELEASGGVTLETVRSIAETGVDRISVGALTHSSVNLDVGLDLS